MEQIDWSGIRAAAVVIGIRAAARQASAHLPAIEQKRFVWRVMQRAAKEKWLATSIKAIHATQSHSPLSLPSPSSKTPTTQPQRHRAPFSNGEAMAMAKSVSAPFSTGSETLENKLADDSKATRVAFSRAARRHAEHLAELKPDTDHKRSIAARNWSQVAGSVHGWTEREAGTQINLNVLTINGGMKVKRG